MPADPTEPPPSEAAAPLDFTTSEGGGAAPTEPAPSEPAEAAPTPKLLALRGVLEGKLPADGSLEELLGLDLADGEAVDAARAASEAEIAALDPTAGAALREARARLRVLALPEEVRARLSARDRERASVDEAQAKAARAQAAAEAESLRAEQAAAAAAAAAGDAADAASRVLAEERLRLAEWQGALAELGRGRALEEAEISGARSALFQRVEAVELTLAADDGPIEPALYAQASAVAERARARLDQAMRQLRETEQLRALTPSPAVLGLPGGTPGRAELLEAIAEVAAAAERAESEHAASLARFAWTAADGETRAEAVRRSCLQRLQPADRANELAISLSGFDALMAELEHVGLRVRWALRSRSLPPREQGADNVVARVARGGGRLFWLALVLSAAFVLWRSGPALARAISAWTRRRLFGWGAAVHLFDRSFALLIQSWAPLLAVATVAVGGWAIDPADNGVLVESAWQLAWWLAWMALVRSIVVQLLRRPTTGVAEVRTLERLSRLTAGVAATVGFGRWLALRLAGDGVLHAWGGRLAAALVVGLVLVALLRFGAEMRAGWFRVHPTGAFSDRLRASEGRLWALPMTALALVLSILEAPYRSALAFVGGLEQSRRAMAYVFRRRLERNTRPEAAAGLRGPPPALVDAFAEAPSGPDRTGYMPRELDGFDLSAALQTWRAGGPRVSLLVVAETSLGRTSWLNAVRTWLADDDVVRLDLPFGTFDGPGFCQYLAEALDLPVDSHPDAQAIGRSLAAGPPKVLLVDDLHRILLRGVDTLGAWRALQEVVHEADDRILWIATGARRPIAHLRWAARGLGVFRRTAELQRWTEADVVGLFDARVGEAPVRWAHLMVGEPEGSLGLEETRAEYARLIWDHADGSPRAALWCWRDSMYVEADGTISMRLFRRVDPDLLDELSLDEVFLLAVVCWSAGSDAAEAARSLRIAAGVCERGLSDLEAMGILERRGGRTVITPPWLSPVFRHLRRKNIA